jgi:uncharacterized coiled-coil DUF342 family protein
MTDDEKRQQKAMLLLECQEARENLANLREKAARLFEPLNDVIMCVKAAADATRSYNNKEATIQAAINADRQAIRKTFDSALDIIEEIRIAEEILQKLGQRKGALGFS